jgi:hypothetical protein
MFGFIGNPSNREPLMAAEEVVDEKPPKGPKRLSTAAKVEQVMKAAATISDDKKVNPAVGECLRAASPIVTYAVRAALFIAPYVTWLCKKGYELYVAAPKNVITLCFGLALCFLGGHFAAVFAAVEAFRQFGWERVRDNMSVVLAEAKLIGKANAKDDLVDDDHDGVADVDQIPPHELVTRKITMAMRTVNDPAKLQAALGALWGAYMAVLATLRLQFAQTVAIAMGIVETVRLPLMRIAAAPLSGALTPLKLQHWTETSLDIVIRTIAVIIAWWVQKVISAFYSGLRGGKIFASALCDIIEEKGWSEYVEKLPGVTKPFSPDTSYFDEVVAYSLAGLGIVWQLSSGFVLGFPINLLLLPLTIIEWFLEWQITWQSPTEPGAAPAALSG